MSAVARVHAALDRIADVDRPEVWIALREPQELLAEAQEVDARVAAGERLPLAGLVAAVKDNIDVAGLPTTAGARSYAFEPERDSTAVARLRAAGAIEGARTPEVEAPSTGAADDAVAERMRQLREGGTDR